MAGPLAGIGQGQPYPLSNPSQQPQSNNQTVRSQNEDEQNTQTNQVQPQGTQAAETQNTETGNQDVIRDVQEHGISAASREISGDEPRGSLIDITV